MAVIDRFLRDLVAREGSDLHLMAGDPPRLRLHGELLPMEPEPLPRATLESMIDEIVPANAQARWRRRSSADFAYALEGTGRFRVNVLQQLNGPGIVCRAIPAQARSLEALGMPPVLRQLALAGNGLVLVTGKTGSGKSTTLAAMVDEINNTTKGHILTIEDPIEFLHARKGCLVSQREVGVHAPDFATALRSALREDPDAILVGELRDLETISIAVTAAEMGILVLGTLHTNGATGTVDRLVNAFPAAKQSHVRTMLSTSLRGIVSQQLLRRSDGKGRVAALEVLVNTPAVSNLIRQGKTDQLETAMQSGSQSGMRTLDNALLALLDRRQIDGADAWRHASNKAPFEAWKPTG
ncbi:MAG: hypothetical protein RL026_171 [Pseudomonadota bacterium]|jgi:twitching motility protein PilT